MAEKNKDWFMEVAPSLAAYGCFKENIVKAVIYQHHGILVYLSAGGKIDLVTGIMIDLTINTSC